ncbi:MAG: N-(5'-phosphoribosyl)anthranilate isomerase [Anaerolineae bacterium]
MIRVKICGITNLEDACLAAEAGADLLGFVFYPPSPRYISPESVRDIVANLRRDHPLLILVGVFVNETLGTIRRVLHLAGLDLAQLHGEEPRALLEALAGCAFKGLRARNPSDLYDKGVYYIEPAPGEPGRIGPVPAVASVKAARIAPDLLVDAYHPRLYGGSGQTLEWQMVAPLARKHRLLLAGGLTPGNVAEAIRIVRPWGVDVSSGVEVAKGRKDHPAVRRFIAAAKGIGDWS